MSMDPECGGCMHEFYRDDNRYRTCLDCGESACRCCGEEVCLDQQDEDDQPLSEPADFDMDDPSLPEVRQA